MRALAKISATALVGLLIGLSLRQPAAEAGVVSVLMEPDGTGVWRDLVASFERRHPTLRVEFVEGPPATNTREDMYSTAFLAGRGGFDVVYSDVVWVPKFAAAGWLMDLTDRISADDREDFLPADVRGGTYQGRLYRIPALTDAGLLYYRKDLISQPPTTFAELIRLARQHRDPRGWGFVWQGKQYEGLVTSFLEVLWGHGGEWINAETRSVHLDEPPAAAALRFMVDLIGDISPPGVTTYTEEEGRAIFQNGRSVFLRNWLYVWGLLDQDGAIGRHQVGFVPMVHLPGNAGATTLGGWGFAISRFSDDPATAWQLVEFLTRPESLARVRDRMGRTSARRSQVPAELLPVLENARPRPPIPEYAQASDILQRALSAALTKRISVEDALRDAAVDTRLLLRRGSRRSHMSGGSSAQP
ncbi:MAG TPA: ABC transporter substrate-binding protein [Vicinamibacterales bacterium]|jgi:multiple sugar transport system substrate-binding protein